MSGNELYSVVCLLNPITNDRILPDTDPLEFKRHENNIIDIKVCKGEYEPASFVIHATQKLEDFLPIVSDLSASDSKEVIRSSNIDIRIVKCWYQGCPDSIHFKYCKANKDGTSRYFIPELLLKSDDLIKIEHETQTNYLKIKKENTFEYINISKLDDTFPKYNSPDLTLPKGGVFNDSEELQAISLDGKTNKQYWLTVFVPPETSPGLYEGSIRLTQKNHPSYTIPIKVEVLDFELKEPIIEYGLYYRGRLSIDENPAIGSEEKRLEQLKREFENMVSHGIVSVTTTQYYYPGSDLFDAYIDQHMASGLNPTLYMLWSGTYFDKIETAQSLIQSLKSKGFNDVYFYGGDELSFEEYQQRFEKWERMKDIGGKIFSGLGDAAYQLADKLDLAVVGKIRDTELSSLYHQKGHKVFSYGLPQVGDENPEIYRRNYGLALWKVGYDGVMNYAYQAQMASIWNDFDAYFRDHVFAYPTSNGLIDTIQWEGFREAVDDIKYLSTLLAFIECGKKRGLNIEHIEAWLKDIDINQDLKQIREKMITYIKELSIKCRPQPPIISIQHS